MQTFPRTYVSAKPQVAFLVDAGGFLNRVSTLDEARAFVADTDRVNGAVRNVMVSKIKNGYVTAVKAVRKDWKNL